MVVGSFVATHNVSTVNGRISSARDRRIVAAVSSATIDRDGSLELAAAEKQREAHEDLSELLFGADTVWSSH
jgi:hypothetical protein